MDRGTLAIIAAVVVIVVVVLTLGIGYGVKRAGKAPGPPEPTGPSVEEIYAHVRPALRIWETAVANGRKDLGPVQKERITESLRTAMSIYENTENGRMALTRIADDVRQLVRDQRAAGNWEFVLTGTDVFSVFRKNEFFMGFYKDLAKTQLDRPEVTLKGFVDDIEKKVTYAFFEVRIPGSNKLTSIQVREGEEFLDPPHTLRFASIIGRNRGVTLEFLAIPGDFFDAMLGEPPKDKKSPTPPPPVAADEQPKGTA